MRLTVLTVSFGFILKFKFQKKFKSIESTYARRVKTLLTCLALTTFRKTWLRITRYLGSFSFRFHKTKKNPICSSFADALQETLGFDWLLLFIQAHLHNTTVVRATRILVTMLSSTPALNRFREGLSSGNWLDGTDVMLNKTTYVVAGMRMIYIYFLRAMSSFCPEDSDENTENH